MDIAISVVSKLIVGFIGLLIVVRVIGKKPLSQISPYDFVYTLVLGGIVEETIYDDQVSILHLILGLMLWSFMIWSIEKISMRNEQLNKKLKGEPQVLIYDGRLTFDNKGKGYPIEFEQLRALMRSAGCYSLRNIKHMILETGGQYNIVQYDDSDGELSLMFVDEGVAEKAVLENHNMSIELLTDELKKLGYQSVEEIIYAEWTPTKGLYAIPYSDVATQDVLIDG